MIQKKCSKFISKLYNILENQMSDVIHWNEDCDAININDIEKLVKTVLSVHQKQNNFFNIIESVWIPKIKSWKKHLYFQACSLQQNQQREFSLISLVPIKFNPFKYIKRNLKMIILLTLIIKLFDSLFERTLKLIKDYLLIIFIIN